MQQATSKQDKPIAFGYVIHTEGSDATIAVDNVHPSILKQLSFSKFVSLLNGKKRIVGVIASAKLLSDKWNRENQNDIRIKIQMIGEVWDNPETNMPVFDCGISNFPVVGVQCALIQYGDIYAIFGNEEKANHIPIGHLLLDQSINATVNLETMLSRHFAIVGSTGVGKSTATTLMIRKIMTARSKLRAVMLDPHNEYSSAFGSLAMTMNIQNINIPFWLLNFEELTEIIFANQDDTAFDVDYLRTAIPLAKQQFNHFADRSSQARIVDVTVDTPIPYRMRDLIKIIEADMGKLESQANLPPLRRLRGRLLTVMNDSRYNIFFNQQRVKDNALEILSNIFRLDDEDGKIITVIPVSYTHLTLPTTSRV